MIVPVTDVDIRFVAEPWPAPAALRAQVPAIWARLVAANPHLWDGRILGISGVGGGPPRVKAGVLRGEAREDSFSAFMAWRELGWPEIGLRELGYAAVVLALPQVPLTLGNAIVAITDENNRLFPDRAVTERQVALSTGIMNVGGVEDYMPIAPAERQALYNVGVDHYLTVSTSLTPTDSLKIRMELRYLASASRDSVVDAEEETFRRTAFETATAKEDFVLALVGLAEPIYTRESERVRKAYRDVIAAGAPASRPLR